MGIDNDRATELAFALISITASTDRGGITRAWKGIDWDLLGEMYERGWIYDPVGKAKSVMFTQDGLLEAERLRSVHLSLLEGVESEIRALEEGMWDARTRFDPDWLSRHVHADFVEFGRSGKVYRYDSLFPPCTTEIDCRIPLPNFKVSRIDRSVVLATYDSHVRCGDTVQSAHRTSTWLENGQQWQLRMHTGTPFDPDVRAQQQ